MGFFSIVLFCAGFQVGQVMGQPVFEAAETVRLYEKIADSDRVPVITCIDLEKSGRLLAVGGDDHLVRLWDIQAKGFIRELQEHLDWVRGLAFNPDQTRLATIGQDGQIKLWEVQNGTLIRSFKGGRGTQKILFHPNGSRFAVCGFDKNVRIYDAATGNLLNTLETHGTNNKAIAFSTDGSLLAVGGRTGVIRVWQTSDYQRLTDLKGDGRRVHALAFSPNASQLASGGDGPFIMVWKPTDGTLLQTLPERPGKTFSLIYCGQTLLASGESDNAIRIWDLSKNQNTATLLGHTGTISTMIYEPTSNRLISGSFDTSLRFWTIPGDSVPAAPVAATPAVTVPVAESSATPFAEPFTESIAEPINVATPTLNFSVPVQF
ncbi:MAG: WD40 repeat domain-containing protein [Planctomycetaceae bacterium]|nr:WD40 repeat domain-containing protein [Planctomycetaceae bacterium]